MALFAFALSANASSKDVEKGFKELGQKECQDVWTAGRSGFNKLFHEHVEQIEVYSLPYCCWVNEDKKDFGSARYWFSFSVADQDEEDSGDDESSLGVKVYKPNDRLKMLPYVLCTTTEKPYECSYDD